MNNPKYKNIFFDASNRIGIKLKSLFIISLPPIRGVFKKQNTEFRGLTSMAVLENFESCWILFLEQGSTTIYETE